MKVGQTNIVLLTVILIIILVVSVEGSVWNGYSFQASPVSCETPRVTLESGTVGAGTIYTNSTSAKVRVAVPRNWWNLNYDYHRRITIVNNVASTLGSGYSVCLTVNTASLVSNSKMLSSGNDLRIVYWNGSSWVEKDRDVIDMNTNSTQVSFKTQADISASNLDNNYYIYYGNPSAMNPPASKSNVYDFWDDFDDGSLDPVWTFSQIGGASGSVSESGTVVTLNATTSGDLWSTSDNLLFLSISRSYNVLVESYTSSWGGLHGTWSKMGGVQLRQSLDADSKNRIMSPVYSATGATNSYRLSTGGFTSEQTTATQPGYNRLSRIGGTSRAWYSADGVSWVELGSQISFSGGLSDPTLVGIHLAGLSSSSHWVEVDWVKVRKYVDPEPSTSVGFENSYSYYPTSCNVLRGNYVSGSVPDSIQAVDSDYFIVNYIPWWNSDYSYRRQVTTANNLVVPLGLGYSVNFVVDTLSLVSAGKIRSDGNDLRAVYWNTTSADWLELDRDVIAMNSSSTRVWFKTQASIGASSSDGNYYMYYGNPSAGSPPMNKNNIYEFWDDFDDSSLGSEWTVESIGGGSHTITESNSKLNITSHYTGDIWGTSDKFTYVYFAGYTGSLEVSAYVSAAGGLATWVKVGGVHLRDNNSTAAKNMQTSPTDAYGLTNSHRKTTSGSTEEDLYGSAYMIPEYLMIRKNNDDITPLRSEDGQSWTSWAYDTVAFTEPFLVGIPVCSMGAADTWAVIEWFKIRLYADPEPSTSLGPETSSKYEVSTEFVFSGMTTNSPRQLNFTVVSHCNVLNVNVTLQVWNYSSSAYVTSGEGHLTYTSTGANVTKALNITTNPHFYTSSGYAKIKVTGINSTGTQFQQNINQIKLTYKYNASSTYDYVLEVVNQGADNWATNLQVYDSSNIGRLLGLNISLHDGTSSNQIAISGGSIVKFEGEPYNLLGGLGSTIYISMNNLQASTTETSYIYIYLKISVPEFSTYNLFIITFEIA